MKMLSAVIAVVIFLCGTVLFLKLKYPSTLLLVATPLVEDGPSLFQMFQAIALSGAAVATLWLTYRRTDAINRQAENAQHQANAALKQIELNQEQLLRTSEKELQETFETALNLLTGEKSNPMSRLAAFNLLVDTVEADNDKYYARVKDILEFYIISETTSLKENLNEEERVKAFSGVKQIKRTEFSVFIATTIIKKIQKIAKEVRKIDISNTTLCSMRFIDFDLRNAEINASWFKSVTFKFCDLREASLKYSRFFACNFIDCNLSNANISGKFDKCKLINCRVDGISLDAAEGWTFERNRHTASNPPKMYPDYWPLYEDDIAQEREKRRIALANEPAASEVSDLTEEQQDLAAIHYYSTHPNLGDAIPAFIVIDDEESETNKDEKDS